MTRKVTYDILLEESPDAATIEDKIVGFDPEKGLKYRRIIEFAKGLFGFYYYKNPDGTYSDSEDMYPVKRVDVFTHEYRFQQK